MSDPVVWNTCHLSKIVREMNENLVSEAKARGLLGVRDHNACTTNEIPDTEMELNNITSAGITNGTWDASIISGTGISEDALWAPLVPPTDSTYFATFNFNTNQRDQPMHIFSFFLVDLDEDGAYASVSAPVYIVAKNGRSARDKAIADTVANPESERPRDHLGDTWDIVVRQVA